MEDKFSLRVGNILRHTQTNIPCPSIPHRLHLTHLLRILRSNIVRLRHVMSQIKQLPATISQSSKTPITLAYSLTPLVLPIHHTLVIPFVPLLKQRNKTASLVTKRLNAVATIERRIRSTGKFHTSRHHIKEIARLRHNRTLLRLRHTGRPMHNSRSSHTTMELRRLPITERRIHRPSPASMQIIICQLTTRRRRIMDNHLTITSAIMTVETANAMVLARSTIVRSKDNQSVVIKTTTLQLINNTTNILVHTVNHSRMHLHICSLESLVCLIRPFTAGRILNDRHLLSIDKAKFKHTIVTAFAHRIPTIIELTLILCNILFLCLHRPMRFLESNIHKERLAVGSHLVQHIYRLIRDEVGIIEVLGNAIGKERFLVMHKRERVEVIGNAPNGSPVLIEASVAWIGFDWCERTIVKRALMRKPFHLIGVVA